jgi:hypothetical protein
MPKQKKQKKITKRQKEQRLVDLVDDYFSHPSRRRFAHLSAQVVEKLKEGEEQGLLTPLRQYLLKSGIVKTEKTAYVHASMFSSHHADIVEGKDTPIEFENAGKKKEAMDDFEVFLAEEEAERAMLREDW